MINGKVKAGNCRARPVVIMKKDGDIQFEQGVEKQLSNNLANKDGGKKSGKHFRNNKKKSTDDDALGGGPMIIENGECALFKNNTAESWKKMMTDDWWEGKMDRQIIASGWKINRNTGKREHGSKRIYLISTHTSMDRLCDLLLGKAIKSPYSEYENSFLDQGIEIENALTLDGGGSTTTMVKNKDVGYYMYGCMNPKNGCVLNRGIKTAIVVVPQPYSRI